MNLKLFEKTYKTIAKSNASKILKAVMLKNQIVQQRHIITEIGSEVEIKDFEESITELNNFFNVEKNLSETKNSFICIQFEQDTEYYNQFGSKEICGSLIEIIENITTKRKHDDGTFYEYVSPFGIKLKCQYGELDIAIGDFKNIENI